MQPIRISGKNLGALALPDFCPRCVWLKVRCGDKLPWQIFPGVFSSLDSYQKKVTNCHYERHGRTPQWLGKKLGQPISIPHHSIFRIIDNETNILLTGVPDEILRRKDGTLTILDYKTARFTDAQDNLLPMYRTQLNAYAVVAERIGLGRVTGLALVYYEPVTDLTVDEVDTILADDGFSMRFQAKILPVELDPESITPLLQKVRDIYDLARAPTGLEGCKDCRMLNALMKVATDNGMGMSSTV